ncbi:MAG: ABC transporter substrate-binding protein [Thermomicrobiales bacterium]
MGASHTGGTSRRDMLRFAAGATGAALLAACGGSGATSTPAAGQATSGAGAPTVSASGSAPAAPTAPVTIVIPMTGANLPTDKITYHWMDSANEKKVYLNRFLPAYQQAHPNITFDYLGLPYTEMAKALPAAIQNGNAPDVFEVPPPLTAAQVVQQGWVQPLDDVIPNFAQWRAAFPPGIFFEGINTFQGKTYTFPFTSTKQNNALLLYNVAYMRDAGIDPQKKPLTWDEFRATAKKITQQGAGKYYGIILSGAQSDRMGALIRSLAEMAGAAGGEINWKTGEYNYSADQFLAAIDLLLSLKADGSVFPGSSAANAPQAVSQFAQNVAGMYINGSYMFQQWRTQNPTFMWDVASQPVANTGPVGAITYNPGGQTWWISAKSKWAVIAGDIFSYVGSEAGQTAAQTIIGGSKSSVFATANQAPGIDPLARKAVALYNQQMRLAPTPGVRNPDAARVTAEMRPLTPDFGTTIQGIYTGQLSDPKKAMQDLKDRADKELDRAIKAAQAKGAKVSRDDWIFPNWDPTKNYTDADYAAIKK